MTVSPTLSAQPARGLIDSDISVSLRGFAPRSLVTVQARVEIPHRTTWESRVIYVADHEGSVDLDRDTPLFGDVLVPGSDGLLWALRATAESPEQPSNSRFVNSGLEEYSVEISAVTDAGESAETSIVRLPVAPGVRRAEVRDDGLAGTLFTPDGPGPFPVVIVVPGSDGGVPEPIAALFASHGVAALALAYFNAPEPGRVPATLTEIPLEYFGTAIRWLERQPALDTSTLTVSGTSRGGELALLLGSIYPEIRAILAWVPSNYVNGGMGPNDPEEDRAAWTLGGEPVEFVRRWSDAPAHREERDGVQVFALNALRRLGERDQHRAAEIPVERINGPILFISGEDDLLWPSATYSRWAIERLREHNFAHEVEHLSYPNAGHSIGPKNNPATVLGTAELPGADPERKVGPIHLGGTPAGVAAARRDAWPKVLDFLRRHTALA